MAALAGGRLPPRRRGPGVRVLGLAEGAAQGDLTDDVLHFHLRQPPTGGLQRGGPGPSAPSRTTRRTSSRRPERMVVVALADDGVGLTLLVALR